MSIMELIHQKMKEAGIINYQVDTVLVRVMASTRQMIGDSDDIHFLQNAYSESTINARVIATNMVFDLNPAILASQVAKYQGFRGQTNIQNEGANILFVEFVKVSPY